MVKGQAHISESFVEMEVPGYGLQQVLRVYQPHEPLPSEDEFEGRFLVMPDGTAYQVLSDG